jgi:NAD+ kinase
MKTAAIVSKPEKAELEQLVPKVLRWFQEHGYEHVWLDRETAAYLPAADSVERSEIAEKKPEFVLVLGGDGTLLSAARAVAPANIPILGVNLGSLGFLTEVPLDELWETLEAVDQHRCAHETRNMLNCRLMRDGKVVAQYDCLNDAVVNKSAISRLVSFDLCLDTVFVSNYKADGVIISTPTGSTAYALAAGGPILMPSVDAMVIVPVCPHSLTHRPLVVKDTVEIEIVVKSAGEEAYLSIDGQVGVPLADEDRVVCRKSAHHATLLRMRKTFFDVLRNKLKMGVR